MLGDMLDIKTGKFVKLNDLKDGETLVLKSGKKQYKKEIKSNLTQECMVLNNMSCDLTFIDEKDINNYYVSSGCYIITLKDEYKGKVLLKYLFFVITSMLLDHIKNLRHGSLQQFISKNDLIKFFSKVKTVSV